VVKKISIICCLILISIFCQAEEISYYDYYGKKIELKQDLTIFAVNINQILKNDFLPGKKFIDSLSSFKGHLAIREVTGVKNIKDWQFLANKLRNYGFPVWPAVIDNAGNRMILDGTIGIEFKSGISKTVILSILNRLDLEVIEIDSHENDFYMVSAKKNSDLFAISKILYESGYIKWAQPNWFTELVSDSVPNDPYFVNQWHLDQISAVEAWVYETGNSSVKIAIIDSGVETGHPDLNVTNGYDFLDNDSDPNPDIANDDHHGVPHGTAVAGIAAAKTNNALGVAGVCQNCTIIPIRLIGGYISSYDIMNALKYAVDQGAWVVNNSWGTKNTSCQNISANSFQTSAIEYGKTNGRNGKGTIMVWAAGNDSCNTNKDGDLKNNDIVVVSALTSSGNFASYSNYGKEVDVSAGAASYTTDITGAYGYNYLTGSSDGDGLSNLDYTSVFSGTSAAAPVVSGSIALMLAANPDLTFSGALNCLKSTARKISKYCSKGDWELQNDIYLESGSKEHSPCFGFGRVDINLMVLGALNETCGTCIKTAEVDLCYGDGSGIDDDCEGGIDDNCINGGNGKSGDPCTTDPFCANSGNDFFCKTEWQDGYCTGNCSSDGDCFGAGLSVCRDNECRAKCVSSSGLRDGYKCDDGIVVPGIPEHEPFCGDGVVEGDEECDDGNNISGDGCSAFCELEPVCEPNEMECRYTALFWCNNGFWELVKNCADEGKICDTNEFTSFCENPGVCGNGIIEAGEECDDGNTVTEKCAYGLTECTVCASNCTLVPGSTEYCGDNIVNGDEECDDGNNTNGDGCDSNCKIEVVFECSPDNMECRGTELHWCDNGFWKFVKDCEPLDMVCIETGVYAICKDPEIPDDITTPDEEQNNDYDYNDNDHVEPDNETNDNSFPDENEVELDEEFLIDDESVEEPDDTATEPVCGNGIVEEGEECDDGNNIPGDGCDPNCRKEKPPVCGNGVLEEGEECDDGNNIPGDGCDPECKKETEKDDMDKEINDDADIVESTDQSDFEEEEEEEEEEEKDAKTKKSSGCSLTVLF
jgi:cysteine-rich repeat protein